MSSAQDHVRVVLLHSVTGFPHTAGSDTTRAYSSPCPIADRFGQAGIGDIGWHPTLSLRRQSSSYTCHMVLPEAGILVTEFSHCISISLLTFPGL